MYNRFEKSLRKIGGEVTVQTNNGTLTGRAVIYPVRYKTNSDGDIQNVCEGVSEPERYVMFCDDGLVKNAEPRDIVNCRECSYMILWKDEFSCRAGSYMRVYLKKIIDRE